MKSMKWISQQRVGTMALGNNIKEMTMNKKRLIYAMAAVAFVVVACQNEEPINQVTPAEVGDEICFGGRAGFENDGLMTRTEYSGEIYTHGGINYERVDWVEGDAVEIYCPEAAEETNAHYVITGVTAGDESVVDGTNKGEDYAYLTKHPMAEEFVLRWSSDDEHNFYAMYPSTLSFVDETGEIPTVAYGIMMDGTTVNGIVPTSQQSTNVTVSGRHYVVKPDMKYAYMVARSTATREKGKVGLSFVPMVTAAEIQLVLPETTTIGETSMVESVTIQEIQVEGQGIAGAFTADLDSWDGTGYPVCENAEDATDLIHLTTVYNGKAIVIQPGGSLTFTVFMLPGADIENLKVSVSATGASYVSKTLQGVTVVAKKKNVFKNLQLPTSSVKIDASNWMSQLPDGVRLTQLSLPGTGGSFSYGSDDTEGYYKSQTLDFEAQWRLGVRAFEVITDRQQGDNFANELLRCNNDEIKEDGINLTVSNVVNRVLERLEGASREGAMIIFTYQPTGDYTYQRNPGTYMRNVMNYINTLDHDKLVLFEQGLTLEDIRGKLLIVVRPTQNDEDTEQDWTNVMNNITGVNADRVLVINGCGTGKDKWGARGYTINGERAYDLSNDHGTGSDIMEYHMQQGVYLSPTESTSPVAKGDPQFGYGTNHPKINCWFQEWARVVGENVRSTATTPNTYWFESYNEKLANVTATFSMAISGEYSNYVFINSLCGYLAGSDFTESIKPSCDNVSGQNKYGGAGGNIKALADKLNPDFYDYVLNCGLQQTTGPTGVVLLDYVSDDPTSAAYALPGTIIANNFKHSISGGDDVENGEGDENDDNGSGL